VVYQDGFASVPEGLTIDLDDKLVAPFSLPQEALSYEPAPEVIVHRFKNGETERKIYNNTKLKDDELEQLQELRKKAEGKTFQPCICVMAARYIDLARGNADEALDAMSASQDWRHSYFATAMRTEKLAKDLEHGILYFIGRDQCLRPTLIFRVRRIPQQWRQDKSINARVLDMFVFCLEYFLRYMIVPGRVEGLNFVADLSGMSVSQIPVDNVRQLLKIIRAHYCGRLFRFYIVNLPMTLKMLVHVAKTMITERQAAKLTILNNPEELLQEYAPHQLESDLGGTHPLVKEFFPFPLLQGPFSAKHTTGPSSDRVPNVHRVLTRRGAQGRLWDKSLSIEDNTKLDYSEEAKEILKRCGLPVPAHCPGADLDDLDAQEAADKHLEVAPEPTHDENNGDEVPPAEQARQFEPDDSDGEEVVKPKGFWSCCIRPGAKRKG